MTRKEERLEIILCKKGQQRNIEHWMMISIHQIMSDKPRHRPFAKLNEELHVHVVAE